MKTLLFAIATLVAMPIAHAEIPPDRDQLARAEQSLRAKDMELIDREVELRARAGALAEQRALDDDYDHAVLAMVESNVVLCAKPENADERACSLAVRRQIADWVRFRDTRVAARREREERLAADRAAYEAEQEAQRAAWIELRSAKMRFEREQRPPPRLSETPLPEPRESRLQQSISLARIEQPRGSRHVELAGLDDFRRYQAEQARREHEEREKREREEREARERALQSDPDPYPEPRERRSGGSYSGSGRSPKMPSWANGGVFGGT